MTRAEHLFPAWRTLALSSAAALAATVFPAAAQTIIRGPGGQTIHVSGNIPPQVLEQMMAASGEEDAPEESPKTPAAGGPTQALFQAIMSANIQRTPERLVAAGIPKDDAKKTSPGEDFARAVLLGDWPQVGQFLARLPEPLARQAYRKVLTSIASWSGLANPFASLAMWAPPSDDEEAMEALAEQMMILQQSRQGRGSQGLLVSDDFFGVIEAAPVSIQDEELDLLVGIGRRVVDGPAGRAAVLGRLQGGLKGFGNDAPEAAARTVRLLCGLGWSADAEPYARRASADPAKGSVADLLLAVDYLGSRGLAARDDALVAQAWQTLFAAAEKGAEPAAVAARAPRLLVAMGTNGPAAIRDLFRRQPKAGRELLEREMRQGRSSRSGPSEDEEDEGGVGADQSVALTGLLLQGVAGGGDLARVEVVNALVWRWLDLAGKTQAAAEQEARNRRQNPWNARVQQRSDSGAPSVDELLAAAPPPDLLARLAPGLAREVRRAQLGLALAAFDEAKARPILAAACKAEPAEAGELCGHFLVAWAQANQSALANENPDLRRMRAMGYPVPAMASQAIPLTRLRQQRNLAHMRELLAEFASAGGTPPPETVARVFAAIHSPAEVFRADDIEQVFGPPEKMDRAQLRALLATMRQNLATSWKDPRLQQSAGTRRSEKDVGDEVARGYRLGLELARRGLERDDASWEDLVARGFLYFDAAEFEREREVRLSEYVDLRDRAFASLRQAAARYAAGVAELPRGKWTVTPYQAWFFAVLGASDLSYLTRKTARDDLGLAGVHDALRAIPADRDGAHVRLFGESLTNLAPRVPPHARQKFLAGGVRVVGEDDPASAPARKFLEHYQGLLDEVRLALRVDGPTRVGHTRPFGALLALEHTRQLARESGGFAKYLQNQAAQMGAAYGGMGQSGNKLVNHREELEKNLRQALEETFEIQSLGFFDAASAAVDLPAAGWQQTPLAYLVLKAKDAAVDRLPSVTLDMDFVDPAGLVVLPVASAVTPVLCSDDRPPARPFRDLEVDLTLDTRTWKEGRAVVDVTAQAAGLLPDLGELLDTPHRGFRLEVKDNGVTVSGLKSDASGSVVRVERTGQFVYAPEPGSSPAALAFPRLKSAPEGTKVVYKRYVDADLEEVTASAATAGIPLPRRGIPAAVWIVVALAAAGGAATIVMVRRRRRGRGGRAEAPLTAPAEPTPFAVTAFLRRISREYGPRLSPTDRETIAGQIRAIETAFFRPDVVSAPPDLAAIARDWVTRLSRP